MSWSRGTCFSALSWSSAVTKSRFMVRLPSHLPFTGPNSVWSDRQKKRGGHPRSIRAAVKLTGVYTRGGGPSMSSDGGRRRLRIAALDVVVEDSLELLDEGVAAQRPIQLAIDEDRRDRFLEGARQADPDVGVLALAGAIDDAAHDRDAHLLDAWVAGLPDRHLVLQVGLDLLGHHLEEDRRRPTATRAGADLGQEAAQAHRLEDLLGDFDLELSAGARLWGERDPDRVADALVEQDRQAGRGRDDPLHGHARLGQAQVERIVGQRGELAVDVD